ncbi:MAG: hypothetical protein HRT90_03405, partial [Candidatus Margulisbacteria bacterium]|nr:hypothetical protein [Candidatus Margulisiibacteriota bacterium]
MTERKIISQLIVLLFKAFEKPYDKELAGLYMNFLIQHDLERVKESVFKVIETSKFFPRIGEILEDKFTMNEANEIKFLARFRRQAKSRYSYDQLDDDIYTVKKYVGSALVEDSYLKEWPWIEQKVIKVYRAICKGHIEIMENPHSRQVSTL